MREERIREIVGEEFEKLVKQSTGHRDPSIMDRILALEDKIDNIENQLENIEK